MKSFVRIGIICVIAAMFVLCGSASAYYIGDQIKLHGINPSTDSIYLYITGPNIPLQDIPSANGGYVTTANSPIGVNLDSTWSAEFYLANKFDAGTYTVYVAAWPFEYSSGHYAIRDADKEMASTTITLNGYSAAATAEGTKIVLDITGTETQTPIPSTVVPTAETKPTSSPAPIFAILAGLGLAVYLLRR